MNTTARHHKHCAQSSTETSPASTHASDNKLYVSLDPRNEDSWQSQAACRGADTHIFFCDPPTKKATAAAVAICKTCVVSVNCYDTAVATGEENGVWGGVLFTRHKAPQTDTPCTMCGEPGRRSNFHRCRQCGNAISRVYKVVNGEDWSPSKLVRWWIHNLQRNAEDLRADVLIKAVQQYKTTVHEPSTLNHASTQEPSTSPSTPPPPSTSTTGSQYGHGGHSVAV